jgi:hypothetical protein
VESAPNSPLPVSKALRQYYTTIRCHPMSYPLLNIRITVRHLSVGHTHALEFLVLATHSEAFQTPLKKAKLQRVSYHLHERKRRLSCRPDQKHAPDHHSSHSVPRRVKAGLARSHKP